TRLRPFTYDVPKCLLKVDSKTILEHQIEKLKKCGIGEITIVVGYKAQMIKDFCNENNWQINFVKNEVYADSNNFFSLWLSKEYFKGRFVCLNSDVLFDVEILKKLEKCNKDITIVVEQKAYYNKEDMKVIIDESGKIAKIAKMIELNKADGEFIGIMKLSDEGASQLLHFFDNISISEIKNMWWGKGIQKLIERDYRVHALVINKEPCMEIDFLEDLKESRKRKW
ncbi:MAG: sugar phosphate nucleotidyltransferase, partial [Petrotogales bacterium]